MTLILLAIIVLGVASGGLITYGNRGYSAANDAAHLLGGVGVVLTLSCTALYMALCWEWFAAEHKANIINREYGTNYTQTEIFYASEVIDTIRNLDRKRYEVNGDLLSDKSAK